MKSSLSGFLLCVFGWILACSLWVLIRFVGLSSVPVFSALDYAAINHAGLFTRGLVVGLAIGIIFYAVTRALDTPVIRQRPYGIMILIHALFALLIVTLILIALSVSESIRLHREINLEQIQSRLISANSLVMLTYYLVVSFVFIMINQINRKFGPGNLRKLISGAFYHPREVELIFMFLDLKDSTMHAERLGHKTFGRLIQDCFIDMSIVSEFGAQFYQYVGDESILFWTVEEGLRDHNCLHAYFAFSRRLERRREYYWERYGMFPEFKAGINIGLATVLEVGEIKREIAYLGDVLNTAARIQGQCKVHQENLLIAESLHSRLSTGAEDFVIELIGSTELRGRSESVALYRVRERMNSEPEAVSVQPAYLTLE